MSRLNAIGIVVIILIAVVNSRAQDSPHKDTPKKSPAAVQESASGKVKRAESVEVVRAMAEAVLGFEDSSLKIRTLILLADMVWGRGFDEAEGRKLLLKADTLIRSVQVTKNENATSTNEEKRRKNAVSPSELRALKLLLVDKASKRDVALSQQLRRSYGLETENPAAGVPQNYTEISENIRSGQIADATKSLRAHIDDLSGRQALLNFTSLLFVMRGHDAEAADKLFVETVTRINGQPHISADDLLILGNYLFASAALHLSRLSTPPLLVSPIKLGDVVVQADVSQVRPGTPLEIKRAYLITSTQILERATYDAGEMMRRAAAAYLLLPHARSFAPESVPQLLNIQSRSGIDFSQAAQRDKLPTLEDGRIDLNTLLESINGIPPGPARDQQLIRICRLLYTKGELEATLAVSEKLEDVSARDKVEGIVMFARGIKLLEKREIAEATKTLNSVKTPLPRFVLRLGLARLYLQQRDETAAAFQLSTGLKEIREERDQPGQPNLMLAAVEMLAGFDRTAATRGLKDAIKVFNASTDRDARVATFAETINIATVSTNFPLRVNGVRYGSLSATLKSLSSEPKELKEILFELKDERVLSEGVLALADTLLA
jgi:hypothetical protein